MVDQITFIHAADLHLGAPFKGLQSISSAWADRLSRAIPAAFNAFIDAAIQPDIDFVVIAGDIFDAASPSYADFSLFVQGMQRLNQAGKPVYFCTGNHDPYVSWNHDFSVLPENVTMLGVDAPAFEVFERDGEPCALIGGRGYRTQSWPEGDDISQGISREAAQVATGVCAPFAIGVLHTGLDIDPVRSPVAPASLYGRGIDYWACGHIHHFEAYPDAQHPEICFSGCPQGRSVAETGPHGILKVSLSQGASPRIKFMPTAQVVWERMTLDISDCSTIAEVQEAIVNRQFALNAEAQCQHMVFRVTLTGSTSLHGALTSAVVEDVRSVINDSYPFFFIESMRNATRSPIDRKALKSEGLFPAVYLREAKRIAEEPDATLRFVEDELIEANALAGTTLRRHYQEMCADAETLVLDLLQQGGGK